MKIKKYNITHEKQLNYKHIKFIDSLNLCKKLIPNVKSYSLKNMTERFKIKSGTHRALSDTIALRELYIHMMGLLEKELNIDKNVLLHTPGIVYDYIY